MQFIDEAKIYVKSGDGGAGCVSFRREANVPKGGPDGGNGGCGGSVILKGVSELNTLIDFRYQQHFKAKKGMHGMGKSRTGESAKDLIIKVPVGTQVFTEDGNTVITDIVKAGQQVVIAKGGAGGRGNESYKSSVNRAPRKSTPGYPGEEIWVWLKLKLISDAGMIGMPNAGKSTFLNAVSRAKPKIADYPFTTLKPMLGVAGTKDNEFVIADIPGLIEGASKGKGLGHRFLKHIERCGVLLHLIDITSEDLYDAYKIIRKELSDYSPLLEKKEEIIALNKCDLVEKDKARKLGEQLGKKIGKSVHLTSAATGNNIQELLSEVYSQVQKFRCHLDNSGV